MPKCPRFPPTIELRVHGLGVPRRDAVQGLGMYGIWRLGMACAWSGLVVGLVDGDCLYMSNRVIDKEFVDSLVDAFAAAPGNYSAAAKAVGCDHRTAKRAWAIGWPKKGIPPISQTIARQQEAARALAQRKASAEVEATRDAQKAIKMEAAIDSAKDREREGQIARLARDNAMGLQAVSLNLAKKGHNIVQNLTDEELNAMSPAAKLKALKTIAEFNEKAAVVADKAITLHRLIMGAPTATVQHNHTHQGAVAHVHVTPNEMVSVIKRAQEAVERATEAGIIDAEFSEAG